METGLQGGLQKPMKYPMAFDMGSAYHDPAMFDFPPQG
jgi:hypothetical protein